MKSFVSFSEEDEIRESPAGNTNKRCTYETSSVRINLLSSVTKLLNLFILKAFLS